MSRKCLLYSILTVSLLTNIFFVFVEMRISSLISESENYEKEETSDFFYDHGAELSHALIETYRVSWVDKLASPTNPRKLITFRGKLDYLIRGAQGMVYAYPCSSAEEVYLYVSVVENAIRRNDTALLQKVKHHFDTFLLPYKNDEYILLKANSGLLALYFYQCSGDSKYMEYAKGIYDYLKRKNKEGVIDNNPDICGMQVPFLIEYARYFHAREAYELGVKIIDSFVKMGGGKS